MLSVNKYALEYIDHCRSRVAEDVSAYQALVAVAKNRLRLTRLHLTLQFEPLSSVSSATWF